MLGNTIGRFVLSANTGNFSGTLAAGNTTVTGFANITSTIQGGSSLTIAGAASGITTLAAGNTTITGTIAAGNTTITGFANVSTSVNSAILSVGTSFIGNTSGLYHTGTVNAASFTTTGTMEAAIFNSTSDVNSKYNIKTIEDPITKVMQMRGVTFTWKSNDTDSMGLIAQEVEQVIPQVVHTDSEGKKSVSYDNIIGLLVEAIKHQQKQINYLISDKEARDGN